jgi:hypothetical protein
MDQTGLIARIFDAVDFIVRGRKGFAIDGQEHEGRVNYEQGLSASLAAFQEARNYADPRTLVLAELTFLHQELQFCDRDDTDTLSSLAQAVQGFEDALRSLEAVEDPVIYRGAEKTHPTGPRNRVQGYPKDAFHVACIAHRTRLGNVLRSPGINMTEKAVLRQRAVNMQTAQGSYLEKQRDALANDQGLIP